MQRSSFDSSALCRSRRELSNAYFLAKFGFDTAANDPVKFARSPAAHRRLAARSEELGDRITAKALKAAEEGAGAGAADAFQERRAPRPRISGGLLRGHGP